MKAFLCLLSARYMTYARRRLQLLLMALLLVTPAFAEDFSVRNIGDFGNVTVMEASGNYNAELPDGTSNVGPRQLIAKEFFKTHKDEYDFLVIFTNFGFIMPKDAVAFYHGVKNDVQGIGQQILDNSLLYGSNGKLQGTIDMGSMDGICTDPLDHVYDFTLGTIAHEMLHSWASYIKFRDWNNNTSSALIGKDGGHWSFLLDTKGSLEYGNQWQDNGNGTFTSVAARKYYSPLDLYLMGIIDKSKVPPMLLIDNPAIDPAKLPEPGVTITGAPRYVTIDDIIAVEGERIPNAKDSRKQLKMAFVFVTLPGTLSDADLQGIETVRNGFLSRYSILTDGQGIVQVASTPKDELPVNPGIRPPAIVPRTLPPNIDDGVKWLAAHQLPDGSWTDFSLTTERDTAEAVTTLQNFPVAQPQFQTGLAWLGSSASANTDFLARRIEAAVQSGGDSSGLVQEIIARRNRDGGWGSGRNFISNPTDTALTLKALVKAGYNDRLLIGSAVAYLQTNQKGDGGWSGDDTVSAIQPSSVALSAFNACRKDYPLESNISRAIAFLAGKQNPDGGFGNSPSTVYDSALALMSLQEAGAEREIANRGVAYLKGLQDENGSWQDSPYQTALAVRAVWQASVNPDLSIKSSDITFIPEKVTTLPTNAVVNAVIWNLGRTDVPQAKVAIYDGAIAPETKVGEQTVAFPGLAPVTVTFSVPITDGKGHYFNIAVDPDNLVKESNKNNNSAMQALFPESTYDFEVLAADIVVSPNPVEMGQNVTIGVSIRNKGTANAYNVPVRFYIDESGAPFDIATLTVDIPAGGTVAREITWKANKAGSSMPLTVQADPFNLFVETFEQNNSASVPVTVNVSTLPNLAVSYKDIVITPNPAKEMGNANISIAVKNVGFSAATNVKVNYYSGVPDRGGILLGSQIIPLIAAGQNVNTAIDWTGIDVTGTKIISVIIDQENAISETAKDDNFAFNTFNILSLPDLVISNNSIILSPAAPKEGDTVVIAVTVQNSGEQDASDVTVRVTEGGNVLGSAVIPVVKGNSQATATITSNNLQTGVHQLTVVVDPENRIQERNKTNNTAVKSFSVQNANLWISERYFSPNGDGVKDTTQLSFILDSPATVSVMIENRNSEVVRAFSGGELNDTSGAVITWDGRDDNHLLMPDGMYVIKVKNQQGTVLGETSVILDTNRSTLLEAIENNSLIYNKLLKISNTVSAWTWLEDDTGIVVNILGGNPEFSPGIYFFSSDGQDAYRLISAELGSIVSFDVSPTGKVAAVLSKSSKQPSSTQWTVQSTIVTTDIDGINLKIVLTHETKYKSGYQGAAWYAQDQYFVPGPIKWSNNGEKLVYTLSSFKKSAEYYNYQLYTKDKYEVWVAEHDGSSQTKVDTIANPGDYFETDNITWSPDDSKIAFSNNEYSGNLNMLFCCRVIDLANNNTIKSFNKDYTGTSRLLWFNNDSLFVEENVYNLFLINLSSNTKSMLAASSRFRRHTGPFISPDRTRFAYTTADDRNTRSLHVQTADGINTTAYVLHIDPQIGCVDPPFMDTPTWSPDGKQLAFIEWIVISLYGRTNYGPKYVILNVDDKSYRRLDTPFSWVGKERFVEWMSDEQNILYVHNNDIYRYSWTPAGYSTFNYYIFSVATGKLYPWLLNQPLDFLQVSPLEHTIAYKTVNNGTTDLMAASSTQNLASELRIIRSNSALLLKGTANDVNFDGYKLEYADMKAPSQWTLVSPPSDVPMKNATFATWLPPQEGSYLVKLTVWDKAGNTTSSIKKVMWNIHASTVTNFFKTLDMISPNGDGIKDTVELNYTVLQPAHLEFNVYDESGNLVRTFLKEYAEKTTDVISWDGRDESGRVVPDGKYKIKVLSFEFSVEVDSTLPIANAALSTISVDTTNNTFYVDFSALAYDKNIKSWKIEYGEGDNPLEWFEYSVGSDILAAKDSNNSIVSPMSNALIHRYESKTTGNDIVWLKGKKLRITAEDFAGNKSTSIPKQIEEKVIFSYWDTFFIPSQSLLPNFASNIRGFETISHQVTNVILQYWDGTQWHDSISAQEIVNGKIDLSWNGASALNAAYGVRAKVLDTLGGEHYSAPVQTMDMFRVYVACPDNLKGVNALLEDFTLLKLQIQSSDDTRFAIWTDYISFDSSKGEKIPKGDFDLPNPDTKPGFHYHIRMVGTGGVTGKTTYTTAVNYPNNECDGSGMVGKFPIKIKYDEAKNCGEVAPGMVTLYAEFPTNITGDLALLSLSYFIQKPNVLQLIRSIDLRNERWSNVTFSTAELVEGDYPVKGVLTFLDRGDFNRIKEVSTSAVMRVDRVLPISRITYPAGVSTKVCPVKINGPGGSWFGIPIEGSITDNGTVKIYELYFGDGSNPYQWRPATAPVLEPGGVVNRQLTGTGSKNGNIGAWDITGLSGSYTVKVKAIDTNGNISCGTTGVSFDTIINIPVATVDKMLISPNDDGIGKDVSLSFQIDKDASVDVKVYKLPDNGQIDSLPVRTLVSGRTYFAGLHNAVWNGRNDAGSPVSEGRYALVINAIDFCGNTAVKWAGVEVDTTPPNTVITFPKPGDALSARNILEVKGTTTDAHFQSYTLEEGQGTAPSSWVTLASGKTPIESAILGVWNTFGHEGVWTVRLTATDKAGNKNSTSSTVDLGIRKSLIKNLQINPRVLSPNNDGNQDTARVSFEVTDTSLVKVDISDSSNVIVNSYSLTASSAGTFDYVWSGKSGTNTALPDGIYNINVTSVLSSNPLITQTETMTAIIDTAKPVIEIKNPVDKAFLSKVDVAVAGTINDCNLASYSLSLSGPSGVLTENTGVQNRTDYILATLTNPAEGAYAIAVEAKDAGENQNKVINVFTIDRTPPKATLESPKTGESFGAERNTVEVTGSIVENNLDKYSVRYGVGDTPAEWKDLISSGSVPTTSKLFSWKVGKDDGIPDGIYTISLYARDKAGQEGEVRAKISIDNTRPEMMITSLKDGDYVKGPVDISGTAYDVNFDKAVLEVSEGRCDIAYKWATLRSFTLQVKEGLLHAWKSLPADGDYCLRLSAQDKAGNKAASEISIKVDTHPPAAPVLTGKLENKTNVKLDWTRINEPDTAGYHVYRNGQRLDNILLSSITFNDFSLKEGSYAYTVKAVDMAGNESAASNIAIINVDVTGPTARITAPLENGKVNELVEIKGTAASSGDFKEYRILVGKGSNPEAWNLVRKSPVPISTGLLAQWNTLGSTEGLYSINLEAEDISGNIATHTISVTIDNTAPVRPSLLSAVVNGQDVAVSWSSNTELDIAGYLLYRNEQLVNATSTVVRNLKSYVISGVTYVDKAVPDGIYQYYLVAMDQAGNVSMPSEAKVVSIDTHPPHAIIVDPVNGSKFEGKIAVKAEATDNDIASIRFQYRRSGDSSWTNAGSPVASSPYMISFDAKALGLGYGQYQLQPVATDTGGRVDLLPTFITVTHADLTAPAAPVNLQAKVNGNEIMLSWNQNTETDMDGYNVYRTSGSAKTKVNTLPVRVPVYQETLLSDGVYGYEITAVDTFANESKFSNGQTVTIWTPVLVQPLSPVSTPVVRAYGYNAVPYASVELFNETLTGKTSAAKVIADAAGKFVAEGITLSRGENKFTALATDSVGSISRRAEAVTINYIEPPSPPSGLTVSVERYKAVLQWNSNPEDNIVGYNVYRDGQKINLPVNISQGQASTFSTSPPTYPSFAFDSNPSTSWFSGFGQGAFNPTWWQLDLPNPELITHIDINWYSNWFAGKQFQIQGWNGSGWVTLLSISNNSTASNSLDIVPAFMTDKIRVYVTDTTNTDYYKRVGISEVVIRKETPVIQPSWQDENLKDKIYYYRVAAINAYGFESALSGEVPAAVGDVTPPAAPQALVAKEAGADVVLNWLPNTESDLVGYRVYRFAPQGWINISGSAAVLGTAFADASLKNGIYRYRISAVDTVGNESLPSNETEVGISVTLPVTPQNVKVTSVPEGKKLDVHWEFAGKTTLTYNVYRSLVAGGPYQKVNLAPLLSSSFTDSADLTNETTYYYVVTAVDAAGNEGAFSKEVSGIPKDISAPAHPVVFSPTDADTPVHVHRNTIDIAGYSEPGAAVELIKGNLTIAKSTAYESDVVKHGSLSYSGSGYFLSPNGQLLAYYDSSTSNLVIKNIAAGTVTPVATGGSLPAWSPNGDGIAYIYSSGSSRIGIFDRSSNTANPLTSDPNVFEYYPSWSGDGKKIVFASNRGGFQDIWIKDIVSGSLDRITNGINASYPSFSPDGTRISYLQGQVLYVLDLASGVSIEVDNKTNTNTTAWSHNGKNLVFVSSRNGNPDLYLYELQTQALRQITNTSGQKFVPVWSYDSKNIAYIKREQDYSHTLMLSELDGQSRILKEKLSTPYSLIWGESGALSCATTYTVTTAYLKGLFVFSGIELEPEENRFRAFAVDDSGNISTSSEEITVTFDPSELPDVSVPVDNVLVYPEFPKPGERLTVSAMIKNTGDLALWNVDVDFYLWNQTGDIKLIKSITLPTLAGAAELYVDADLPAGTSPGMNSVIVIADPPNTIMEKDENNNYATKEFYVTDKEEVIVTSTTDSSQYSGNQETKISVALRNSGVAKDGVLNIAIEDETGNRAALLDSVTTTVSYGSYNRTYSWNTGATFASSYRLHAVFTATDGTVTESSTPFTILPDIRIESGVVTDRQGYGANDSVAVTLNFKNNGSNYLISQMKARVRIVDANNATLLTDEKTVLNLFPAMGSSLFVQWNSGLNVPGDYRAVLEAYLGDKLVSTSYAQFAINPVVKVSGTITVEPATVLIGNNLKTSFAMTNSGNTGASGVVRAVILDPASLTTVAVTAEQPVNLDINSYQSGEFTFPSLGLELKPYLINLQYTSQGNQKSIASAPFTVKDGTPPLVTIVTPIAGSPYNTTIPIVALATDNASGVEKVEYQIDGGAWKLLPLADPVNGKYSASWEPTIADNGFHNVSFRGSDRAGNLSVPVSIRIEIQMDNIPPVTVLSIGTPKIEMNSAIFVTGNTTFTLNATDNFSGVARTEYRIDSGEWTVYAPFHFSSEGSHLLEYRSVDNAGNVEAIHTLSVITDNTPPVSLLTLGVEQYGVNGNLYISGRTGLSITATDNLSGVSSSEYSIDGAAFIPYSAPVNLAAYPEGSHTIAYRSIDKVGKVETARKLTVVLDKTPPRTSIVGSDTLVQGVVNTVSPKTSFNMTTMDNLSGVKNIWYRIDGGQWQLFSTEFTLAGLKAGSHVISYSAVDNVANEEPEKAVTVQLVLAEVKKEISLEPVVLVGAWIDNLKKVKNQEAIDTLKSILSSLGVRFYIAADGEEFKAALRSGRYTTYILVDYKDEKLGWEIREAINYGDGMIFIKTCSTADPVLDETFGVKFIGKTTGDNLPVNLQEGLLGPAITMQSNGKPVVIGEVMANTAKVLGQVDDKHNLYPALVYNEYGSGKVLLYTFDLLGSSDKQKVAKLIGNSVALLKPEQHKLRPFDSVPVRITVVNSTEPFWLRITETILEGTTVDTVTPQGVATGTTITWQQYLAESSKAEFGYYLNLPDVKGEYVVTTDIEYANNGDYRSYETSRITGTVLKNSTDLLQAITTELNGIQVTGSNELVILVDAMSRLSHITLYPVDVKGAKKSIEAVTTVAKLISGLSADTAATRLMLDELLKILERKWYLINLREQTGSAQP